MLSEELITMNLLQFYRQAGTSVNKLGPEGCVTEQVIVMTWILFDTSECSGGEFSCQFFYCQF